MTGCVASVVAPTCADDLGNTECPPGEVGLCVTASGAETWTDEAGCHSSGIIGRPVCRGPDDRPWCDVGAPMCIPRYVACLP
jgi:hypothetical protein